MNTGDATYIFWIFSHNNDIYRKWIVLQLMDTEQSENCIQSAIVSSFSLIFVNVSAIGYCSKLAEDTHLITVSIHSHSMLCEQLCRLSIVRMSSGLTRCSSEFRWSFEFQRIQTKPSKFSAKEYLHVIQCFSMRVVVHCLNNLVLVDGIDDMIDYYLKIGWKWQFCWICVFEFVWVLPSSDMLQFYRLFSYVFCFQ